MVTEVYKGIFKIEVGLGSNPLRVINSYFIPGEEYDLLIDTGFRMDQSEKDLSDGLRTLGSHRKNRKILCTHLHSDHSGLSDLFAGPDLPIYMSATDLFYLRRYLSGETDNFRSGRFEQEGFPEEELNRAFSVNPAEEYCVPALDERYTAIHDGDVIKAGPYELKTIEVPGHTPGNCMFYMEKEEIMFTGDHVLFDITPNITNWRNVEDSLGDYLRSLHKVKDIPVQLALPGHRSGGNYAERIDAILAHHQERLESIISLIRENPGINAYDLSGLVKWKIRAADWSSFPLSQKLFAVGECLAHLDHLCLRGQVHKEMDGGVYHYFV